PGLRGESPNRGRRRRELQAHAWIVSRLHNRGEPSLVRGRITPRVIRPLTELGSPGKQRLIGAAERGDGLLAIVVQGPKGFEIKKMQEFAGGLGGAGEDDLAAALLGQRVAAHEKRHEYRADVIDLR